MAVILMGASISDHLHCQQHCLKADTCCHSLLMRLLVSGQKFEKHDPSLSAKDSAAAKPEPCFVTWFCTDLATA